MIPAAGSQRGGLGGPGQQEGNRWDTGTHSSSLSLHSQAFALFLSLRIVSWLDNSALGGEREHRGRGRLFSGEDEESLMLAFSWVSLI